MRTTRQTGPKYISPKRLLLARIINGLIVAILGAAFLGYSIFYKAFAELCLEFRFLRFPVFIGEIILFCCMALLVIKWAFIKKEFSGMQLVLSGAYLAFLLIKAASGYLDYGPFAFREAAMFYYPIFALIAYDVCPLNSARNIHLLLPVFFTLLLFHITTYYNFTYLILMLLYIVKVRNLFLRSIVFILMFLFFPFHLLVHVCRTQIVGHFLGFLTLIFLLLAITPIRMKYKAYIISALTVVFVLVFAGQINRQAKKIVGSGRHFLSTVHYWDALIEQRKDTYRPRALPVRIYNREENNVFSMREYPLHNAGKAEAKARKTIQFTSIKNAVSRMFEQSAASDKSNILPRDRINIVSSVKDEYGEYNTGICRLFIWMDMLEEVIKQKAWLGLSFGKPFRSVRLELTGMAASEWTRDGWVASHNSYIGMIYRAGALGLFFIGCILFILFKMARSFVRSRSFAGISLVSILVYWLAISLFYVTFEMPYSAISFWTIFGITLACLRRALRNAQVTHNEDIDHP